MVSGHHDVLGDAQAMVLCAQLHLPPPRVRDDLAVEPLADNVLEEDLRALLESELAFGLRSPILLRWPLHGEG